MELSSNLPSSTFGQFSVGYGQAPGSFTAFSSAQHTDSFSGNSSLQGYYINNPQVVPAAVVNVANGPSPIVGNTLDPGQIFLHPGAINTSNAEGGPIQNAIVRFAVPTTGVYSIVGDWESLHFGTTSKQILVNGQSIFSNAASTSAFNLSANLNANDYVDFLVNPAGIIAGDSVGLRAALSTQVAAVPKPGVLTLGKLSSGAYNATASGTIDSYAFIKTVGDGGLQANVYRNGNQVVVAVKGTDTSGSADTVKNLLADMALTTDGKINKLLVSYSTQLATLLKGLQDDPSYKNANVTLTGHSLGGAVAQLVGSVATGLSVTTFDAPGAKLLLDQPYSNSSSTGLIGTFTHLSEAISAGLGGPLGLSNFNPDLDRKITNYRLAGDQVSMAGRNRNSETDTNQVGTLVTVANLDGYVDVCAKTCFNLPYLYSSVLRNHDPTVLEKSIAAYCPEGKPNANCVAGFNNEPNNVAEYSTWISYGVLIPATGVCALDSLGVETLRFFQQNVTGHAFCETLSKRLVAGRQAVDPPPGTGYFVKLNVGSPLLGSFSLPLLDSIFGWALQYHDQNGWSAIDTGMGAAEFQFANGVDALSFVPVDASGNPTFNPNFFYFGFSTISDGDFSATVFAFGNPDSVPEPTELLLFATACIALLASRRSRPTVRA